MAGQKAVLIQLHGQGQSGLTAQTRQQTVGLLLFNDPLQCVQGQGLQVDLIRQSLVSHNGGGVGVHQHYVHPRLLQDAAGLGAGVVKLRRLTDDDGAGTDHQHLFDAFIQRHVSSLPSSVQESGQTEIGYRGGRSRPPGGTGRRRPAVRGNPRPHRCRRWR